MSDVLCLMSDVVIADLTSPAAPLQKRGERFRNQLVSAKAIVLLITAIKQTTFAAYLLITITGSLRGLWLPRSGSRFLTSELSNSKRSGNKRLS